MHGEIEVDGNLLTQYASASLPTLCTLNNCYNPRQELSFEVIGALCGAVCRVRWGSWLCLGWPNWRKSEPFGNVSHYSLVSACPCAPKSFRGAVQCLPELFF